jgi:hypothetical protein
MRYLALVSDYDGTLAAHGKVSASTVAAMKRLRESVRRLLLVTGRLLSDLLPLFPEHDLFDRIVGENGAVVWTPGSSDLRLLGEPPPERFIARLRELGVPISVGRILIATHEPHETTVLDVIRELGLEYQVIFNKGAVMVLPSGINKATGLRAALAEIGVSAHNAVAVGDAENDHTLLAECEAGVAVQNALDVLKERADWVTPAAGGDGVAELARAMLATDLGELEPRLARHHVIVGAAGDGRPVAVSPYGPRILVCGASGSGKSTLAAGFLERLTDADYRYCLIDPEGDFINAPGALVVGDESKEPTPDEVLDVLRAGESSVVANLLGVPLAERPRFLGPMLARLGENRVKSGMPHFIVIDEAHHMLPEGDVRLDDTVAGLARSVMLLTVHPERLANGVLRTIDELFVVGQGAGDVLRAFSERAGVSPHSVQPEELVAGEAFHWSRREPGTVERVTVSAPKAERRRHERKYASGELGQDKSFYFRGPQGALNLRASNLALFLQMADGVDDATWIHHLKRHDYSRWLRQAIKNDALSWSVYAIETDGSLSVRDSRSRVRSAIEGIYTLPE